jgi:hypothetical protein
MGRQENDIINAIDKKAQLERAATPEEILAIMVATGMAKPSLEMPVEKAREICDKVYSTLSRINMKQQIYRQSLTDHNIPQIAAAYPYVLKKVVEESVVHVDTSSVLDGLSDEEKAAIKKMNANILRQRYGDSE